MALLGTEIIARFADGRLLVRQEKLAENYYTAPGLLVRVGLLNTVERVISVDAHLSGYPNTGALFAPLGGIGISGGAVVCVKLYRDDIHLAAVTSSSLDSVSGYAAYGVLSAVTSGFAWHGAITSNTWVSGHLNVILNVVGR